MSHRRDTPERTTRPAFSLLLSPWLQNHLSCPRYPQNAQRSSFIRSWHIEPKHCVTHKRRGSKRRAWFASLASISSSLPSLFLTRLELHCVLPMRQHSSPLLTLNPRGRRGANLHTDERKRAVAICNPTGLKTDHHNQVRSSAASGPCSCGHVNAESGRRPSSPLSRLWRFWRECPSKMLQASEACFDSGSHPSGLLRPFCASIVI